MKLQEIQLIDRAALGRLMASCPDLSPLRLAHILLVELEESLAGMEAERQEQTPAEQELASLALLRPSDEQLRRALLRLLSLRDAAHDRPLLYKKTHWLAVCRALQHIGYITEGHGAWAEAEYKIQYCMPTTPILTYVV